MTIKDIKEQYKEYKKSANEKNSFVTYDYKDGNGKVVIIVNTHRNMRKYVTQVVRVNDGKEMFSEGSCRPCDNLEDAIDVAGEMF